MPGPAIRLGDMSAHGGVVTIGYPKVLIGGMPAARLGDMHVCPMFDGPKPHVGGPIAKGSMKVLIGGMPAAHSGDLATCVGPPDVLTVGATTVLVGGSPAPPGGCAAFASNGIAMALFGSTICTPERGSMTGLMDALVGVTAGFQGCVRRDRARYWDIVFIEGTEEFRGLVWAHLDRLVSGPAGRELVSRLQSVREKVIVRETRLPNSFLLTLRSQSVLWPGGPSKGAREHVIFFNPHFYCDAPPSVVIGHMLIRCLHRILKMELDASGGTRVEIAIGPNGRSSSCPTENDLRAERGLPPRERF
jgi:uncharacterized Zn-binding protein involved in type VI secretion